MRQARCNRFLSIPTLVIVGVAIAVVVGSLATTDIFAAGGQTEETARMLAQALISGRVVVARHQKAINAETGDKGFTPDYFVAEWSQVFKERTQIDFAAIKPDSRRNKLLIAFVDASRKTVSEAQELINMDGLDFKGFIPAVYGRETGNHFTAATGITLKQASDRYRNMANKPDAYEAEVIEAFHKGASGKLKGRGEFVDEGGQKVYRYMHPIFISQACLKCHGDKVGDLDIAGHKKEGYKTADLRGAISVTIPAS